MASYGLKRILGLRSAVIINLGAIIGAGIFVIIGIAAGMAGPAIIISIFVSAVIAIFTGLSFSEIAQHISKEGGVYEYAKESFAPSAGFVGGTMWTFSNMIAISAVSLSMGSYINALFHLHINLIVFGIPVIIMFAILNMLGIKNSAKTLSILVGVNVIILIIFVVSGLFYFKFADFSNFAPHGFTGVMEGSALIFFAFTGFSRITTVGDEVKNPEKNIPKAIIISIIISSALYAVVASCSYRTHSCFWSCIGFSATISCNRGFAQSIPAYNYRHWGNYCHCGSGAHRHTGDKQGSLCHGKGQ